MTNYKLPNGEYKKNPEIYASVWRTLGEPIEEVLGVRLYGMDPDFTYIRPEAGNLLTLTVEDVQKITALSKVKAEDDNL